MVQTEKKVRTPQISSEPDSCVGALKVASRRSPNSIALELLDCIEEKEQATKWDLVKVLGNETQFRIWITKFFIKEKIIVERREGRHYYYTKTERGELFHKLLKSGNLIKLFTSLSGRRLRR
jgi:predicted transcriptional regulator